MGTAEIRSTSAGVYLRDYTFRFKAAFRIIQLCPRLLRILYPVYRAFRMLVYSDGHEYKEELVELFDPKARRIRTP